jgi:hypothetical protein
MAILLPVRIPLALIFKQQHLPYILNSTNFSHPYLHLSTLFPLRISGNGPNTHSELPLLRIKETPNHNTPSSNPPNIQRRRIILWPPSILGLKLIPPHLSKFRVPQTMETIFVQHTRSVASIRSFLRNFVRHGYRVTFSYTNISGWRDKRVFLGTGTVDFVKVEEKMCRPGEIPYSIYLRSPL